MTNNTTVLAPVDLTACDSIAELALRIKPLSTDRLHLHGAFRLQTSCLKTVADFHQLLTQMNVALMRYEFASTPRSQLSGEVYSSTEYPADQEILLHNEMAYTTVWPEKLWFFCETPSTTGGETPIADSRAIYLDIPAEIRRLFEQKQLLYVRNYRPGLDIPWQKVFNTTEKLVVEQMCRKFGLQYEWRGEELKTWQVVQSTTRHPLTQEQVWFNQAHLFHLSNLPLEYREMLLSMFREDELPRNVLFADGTPIEEAMLTEIKAVMAKHKQKFCWQAGEIMLLDNLLFAHGREPYAGQRKIAVAME